MKIAYEHLLEFFQGKPTESDISEKLFQLAMKIPLKIKYLILSLLPIEEIVCQFMD